MSESAAAELLRQAPAWQLTAAGTRIVREFAFKDFVASLAFVNAMAEVAEAEGHHPDFTVHYNRVRVEIWTHAIGGLSENDFILAAKIDALPVAR